MSIENEILRWCNANDVDRIFTVETRGAWWMTNGHVLFRMDAPPQIIRPLPGGDGSAVAGIDAMLDAPRSEATYGRPYVDEDGHICRDMGPIRLQSHYIALTEAIYAGVTWEAPRACPAPAIAIVNGVVVAMVMSTAKPARGDR